MVPHKIDANVTHNKYGIIKAAAILEYRLNRYIVMDILIQSRSISKVANPNQWYLKNNHDQRRFKISCMPNQ
jgi:hypothetical protein